MVAIKFLIIFSNIGNLSALAAHAHKINLGPDCKIFRNSEKVSLITLNASIKYKYNVQMKENDTHP